MSHTYDVYALGNALVDLQHSVSEEFLQSQQIDKGVMTLIDAQRQESLFAAIGAEPHTSASGGSAANTAIGVARFGGSAFYACQVGDDTWGDFYIEDLKNAGVDSNPANRSKGRTGQCLVFITPDADRTLNTFLGGKRRLGPRTTPTQAYSC